MLIRPVVVSCCQFSSQFLAVAVSLLPVVVVVLLWLVAATLVLLVAFVELGRLVPRDASFSIAPRPLPLYKRVW